MLIGINFLDFPWVQYWHQEKANGEISHHGNGSGGTGRNPVKDKMLLPHQNQAILSQQLRPQGAHHPTSSGAINGYPASSKSPAVQQFLHSPSTSSTDLDERQWHLGQCAILANSTTLQHHQYPVNSGLSTPQISAFSTQ